MHFVRHHEAWQEVPTPLRKQDFAWQVLVTGQSDSAALPSSMRDDHLKALATDIEKRPDFGLPIYILLLHLYRERGRVSRVTDLSLTTGNFFESAEAYAKAVEDEIDARSKGRHSDCSQLLDVVDGFLKAEAARSRADD